MATITVIAGGALQPVQHASRQSELGASLARSGMCEESVRDVQQHINKTKTSSANQLTTKANGCYAIDFLPLLPGHWLQRINPLTQLNT